MEGPLPAASPGANGTSTSAATTTTNNPFPAINPQFVVEYLVDLLQITLGASRKDLEAPGSLLSKAKYGETVQRCTRFATESQVVMYVLKDAVADAADGAADAGA